MNTYWRILLFGFLMFRMSLSGQVAALPAGSVVGGLTLEEWSVKWWQWQLAMETDVSPFNYYLPSAEHCAHQGQDGPVFFLAGITTILPVTNRVVRSITISSDKYLFFPIINHTQENVGKENNLSAQELREGALILTAATLMADLTVNGTPVSRDRILRLRSPIFSYTIPATNNIFQFFDLDQPGGLVEPAAAEGYYVMLEPMPLGEHVVHFQGQAGEPLNFGLDVEYRVTVVPPSLSYELEVLVSLVRCSHLPDRDEKSLLRLLAPARAALKNRGRKAAPKNLARWLERFQTRVQELVPQSNPDQTEVLRERAQRIMDQAAAKRNSMESPSHVAGREGGAP